MADTVGDVGTLISERFGLNSSQFGLLRTRFGRVDGTLPMALTEWGFRSRQLVFAIEEIARR